MLITYLFCTVLWNSMFSLVAGAMAASCMSLGMYHFSPLRRKSLMEIQCGPRRCMDWDLCRCLWGFGVSISYACLIENLCSLGIVHQTVLLLTAGGCVFTVIGASLHLEVNASKAPPLLEAVMRAALPLPNLLFVPASADVLVNLNPLCTEHMLIILAHIVRRSTRLMQAGGQEDDEQGESNIRQNGVEENEA